MLRPPPLSPRPATLFPYTTLFRSPDVFGKSVPTAGNHVLKTASMSVTRARYPRRYAFVAAALLASAGGAVIAQQDGDSGPVALADDSSGAFEVAGIEVDVTAKSPDAARLAGFREAPRQGRERLFACDRKGVG